MVVYTQGRQMNCVERENVYKEPHFNVHTEKHTLDMTVAWKTRAENGKQKILGEWKPVNISPYT